MNTKIFSTLAAFALALVVTPTTFAAKLSPAQFTAGVKAAVGTKKGAAAYKAAAKYYKTALADKNNKKNAVTYTTAVLKALKKAVKTPLVVKSRAALADALTQGYFKGMTYKPEDSKYAAALAKLVSTLPSSLKTSAAAKEIAAPVIKFNDTKGGGAAGISFINDTIYKAAGQEPPHS
jgi:hypothetical protein